MNKTKLYKTDWPRITNQGYWGLQFFGQMLPSK